MVKLHTFLLLNFYHKDKARRCFTNKHCTFCWWLGIEGAVDTTRMTAEQMKTQFSLVRTGTRKSKREHPCTLIDKWIKRIQSSVLERKKNQCQKPENGGSNCCLKATENRRNSCVGSARGEARKWEQNRSLRARQIGIVKPELVGKFPISRQRNLPILPQCKRRDRSILSTEINGWDHNLLLWLYVNNNWTRTNVSRYWNYAIFICCNCIPCKTKNYGF